jgi:hypothetical protein
MAPLSVGAILFRTAIGLNIFVASRKRDGEESNCGDADGSINNRLYIDYATGRCSKSRERTDFVHG